MKDGGDSRARAISDQNRICAGDQSAAAASVAKPEWMPSYAVPPGLKNALEDKPGAKFEMSNHHCASKWRTKKNIALKRSTRVPLIRRKRGGCSLGSFVFIKALLSHSGALTAQQGWVDFGIREFPAWDGGQLLLPK